MKEYEFHEIANIFPLMQGADFEALCGDIEKNGLRELIVIHDGMILDGRNRFRACQKTGVEPEFSEYEGGSPIGYVLSLNLHRRHLKSDQRAAAAVEALPLYEKEAKARQIRKPAGSVVEIIPPQSAGKSRDKVAKKFETNPRYVSDMKKIKEDDPETFEKIKAGEKKLSQVVKQKTLTRKIEENKVASTNDISDNKPAVFCESYERFLSRIHDKSIDVLITDPPYSTDVEDIEWFVADWLLLALSKVKTRAYVCIGAYPRELKAYLDVLLEQDDFILDNPLIWTYRNTLGVTPKEKYNLNYQVILHLYKEGSSLDTSVTNEMFSVQDINAPDGRQGDRFHTWQKPSELANRLIRHSTKPGDKVIDPFACTGTFLIAAAKHGCLASGCDIDSEAIEIAVSRGCSHE